MAGEGRRRQGGRRVCRTFFGVMGFGVLNGKGSVRVTVWSEFVKTGGSAEEIDTMRFKTEGRRF